MNYKKLLKTVTAFREGILVGGPSKNKCWIVSAPLCGYLSMCGVEVRLVEGKVNHWFLELPDGRIIDPTSDQFKKPDGSPMPKVYIGEKPEWYDRKLVAF